MGHPVGKVSGCGRGAAESQEQYNISQRGSMMNIATELCLDMSSEMRLGGHTLLLVITILAVQK